MKQMTVFRLLDRLEEMIQEASRIPLTGKIIVEQEDALELLEKLKLAIPEDLSEAEWIKSEKARLMMESQEKARNIIKEAEGYMQMMLDENQLLAEAEERAGEIIAEARKAAGELEKKADAYAEQVLAHIQDNLEKALRVIKKGREELIADIK
ncbi:MAG: hypothetical protein ACM3WV_04720 [Bacillota bacterium]